MRLKKSGTSGLRKIGAERIVGMIAKCVCVAESGGMPRVGGNFVCVSTDPIQSKKNITTQKKKNSHKQVTFIACSQKNL